MGAQACEHKVRIVTDLPPTAPELRTGTRSWVETCRECGLREIKKATVQLWKQWTLASQQED